MVISLDVFRNIDPSFTGRVNINGDSIVSGKQSFFGRVIGILTGARQKENKAVYASLANALTAEYGDVGKDVLSAIRPKDRAKLTGANIKVIAERAKSLKSQYEALKIPYSDKTHVGRCIDENLETPAKQLGKGAFNTVFLGKYRRPDGSVMAGVFKKEAPNGNGWVAAKTGIDLSDPQFGRRNIATSRLDERLGLGVIPHTEFGVQNGELGIVMELAPGSSRVKTNFEFELTGDIGNKRLASLATNKDDLRGMNAGVLDAIAGRNGLEHLRFEGDKLMATGNVAVDMDYTDPVLLEKLNDLQWLDALCAQGDRHRGNYIVEQNFRGKVVGVRGIDNDQSFGKNVIDPNGIQHGNSEESHGFKGRAMPDVISAKTAQAFRNMTQENLRAELEGLLTEEEIAACVTRLVAIKGRIDEIEQAGKIIASGQWSESNLQLVNFLRHGPSSYVARDLNVSLITLHYDDVAVRT